MTESEMRDASLLSAKRRGLRQPAAAVRSGSLLPGGGGGFVKECLLSFGQFINGVGARGVNSSCNHRTSFPGSRLPVAYSGSRLPRSTEASPLHASAFVIRNSAFGFSSRA